MKFMELLFSAASDFIASRTAPSGEDDRSKAPGLDNRPLPCPPIIISEVIPISHKRDQESYRQIVKSGIPSGKPTTNLSLLYAWGSP
jgi:hypothetical protein